MLLLNQYFLRVILQKSNLNHCFCHEAHKIEKSWVVTPSSLVEKFFQSTKVKDKYTVSVRQKLVCVQKLCLLHKVYSIYYSIIIDDNTDRLSRNTWVVLELTRV